MPSNKPWVVASTRGAACLGLDNDIIRSDIVVQIPFVNAEEQHAISLSDKITPGADKDKIVVIVANHRD